MKIPSPVRSSTQPSAKAHSYLEGDSRNGLGNVGRGLGNMGETISKVAAVFQQRDEQTDRFNTLKDFSEFDTSMEQSLTELKRNYQADGKGFTKAASDLYDKQGDAYLSKVPPQLQPEFRARLAQNKQNVMGQALAFQYQAGDAWFKQGIADELNKSKGILDQNPGALQDEQKRMASFIMASDLPQGVKIALARDAQIGLESVTFKSEMRNHAATKYDLGVGKITDFASAADALIKKEEGFVSSAMWDVNHSRVGYSSDTITNPDGSFRPVRAGDTTTRADAQRDLDRRIAAADSAGRKAVGSDRWDPLAPNVKAALASVYYHYGHYPQEVIRAVETGQSPTIAAAVRGLGSNPERRAREAAIIEGSSSIEADPRFANIPYEDKIALMEDADREAQAQRNAQEAAIKDARNAQQEALFTNLYDGNAGAADIQAARQNGTLDSYDSIKKANDILNKVNETVNLQSGALTKLQGGGAWDPSSENDKKMLNALVGKQGIERINSGDQDYITQGIRPLVAQTGDIPTDVAGTLTGMYRGNNSTSAMFALDAMAQLRDTNPLAFNQRFGNDVAQAVEMWDLQKDLAPDRQALLDNVRGGTTAQERNNRTELRRDAQAILSKTEGGVPNVQTLAQRAMGEFGTSFLGIPISSPHGYINPLAQQSFNKEFSTLFVDKYSLTGNVDTAVDLASKELQRNWGMTTVGDQNLLMKYPPEKVGYRKIMDSYDWINKAARQDLGLKDEETFQLFSDEQTKQEWDKFKSDPSAQPPSYQTFVIDDNGVARLKVDERGQPVRVWFQPPQDLILQENDEFDRRAERYTVEETIANYPRLQAGALASKTQVPQEDTDAYNRALARRKELDALDQKAQERKQQASPSVAPIDVNNFAPGSF